MRIAIIGAGHVGTTLGTGWTTAGHTVTYGARDPASGAPHPGAASAPIRDAVIASEIVVLATPWPAVGDALAAAGDLGGKPLLDVTNPIAPGLALALGHSTSGGEQVAQLAKGARVVKAFNTTGVENMAAPRYGNRRLMMPVAGDDRAAVEVAAKLATDLGFEAVALPALARARELEPLGLLWIKLAMQWGHGRQIGFAIARRTSTDQPSVARTKARQTITIVGTGNIGGALARGWLRAGHHVRLAVRDSGAADVQELVSLGASAVPVAGAADGSDVVVFAVPAGAVRDLAGSLGKLDGKIVVDCTNAIGKGFVLEYGHTTSSAEELAKALPGARVVRSFNQQGAETLQNPMFGGTPATNFVASDDAAARALVAQLAIDLGLDAVEVGPLASSRLLEPITLLWIAIAKAIGTRDFGLSLLRR
jgi:hypothetical protein